jgi:structural maintenance of chromosome 2
MKKLEEKIIDLENKNLKISGNINIKFQEKAKNEKEYDLMRKEKEKLEAELSKKKIEISNLEVRLVKYDKDLKVNYELIKKLEKENPWILTDYELFGVKDSEYDFTGFDINVQSEILEKLKEENEILKRKVNMKVDTMTDKSEKLYEDLINRKEILMKDKIKIEKAIMELDEKRKEALTQIYEHTNKFLNSIYSSLLPGTKAKLAILPGKGLMDGLELKVAFNNTWKASLSELSGGQRSLLALSLILSLLRYKPAPFYILDEIDAALDLSHTANLGVMIKEQFPQSQFIVVSLKDGMFTNANVLYKVTFSDGSSRVERIAKERKG